MLNSLEEVLTRCSICGNCFIYNDCKNCIWKKKVEYEIDRMKSREKLQKEGKKLIII